MAIKVVHEHARDYPQIFCDQCGQRIAHYERAAYAYRVEPPEYPPSGVLFFHLAPVGNCMDAFERDHDLHLSWIPLGVFCEYLMRNIGLDAAAEREAMAKDANLFGL
jgi:hypothetical protein